MLLVGTNFLNLQPYKAGKPIEETKRELGLTDVIKLASNENCYGPSPRVAAALSQSMPDLQLYPDAAGFALKQALTSFYSPYGITSENLVLGNGTDELINMVVRTFVLEEESAINLWPTFPSYHLKLHAAARQEQRLMLGADLSVRVDDILQAVTPHTKMVFLANPNNPSGTMIGQEEFARLVRELPAEVLLFVDEAYAEYVTRSDYPDSLSLLKERERLIISRTFSKIYGLAGLRIGYLITNPQLADYLNRGRDPFNVNSLGQLAAVAALGDQDHVARCREQNSRELAWLKEQFTALGLKFWPAVANFILVNFDRSADEVFQKMLRRGVIIRSMSGSGLFTCGRITVGTHEQNVRCIDALSEVLNAG